MFNSISSPTVHTLALTHDREIASAHLHYDRLQETELYDPQRGQWNRYCGTQGGLADSSRMLKDQLLGVVVESNFSPGRAAAKYHALSNAFRIDSLSSQWPQYFKADQELDGHRKTASTQLVGLWALSTFDRTAALSEYKRIETRYRNRDRVLEWDDNLATDLTAAIIQEVLNPGIGRPAFEKLRASSNYWHVESREWRDAARGLERDTETELLGVFAEVLFQPEGAASAFHELQQRGLFEKQSHLWRYGETNSGRKYELCSAFDQLLAVLIELKIEEIHHRTAKPPPRLPTLTSISIDRQSRI